MNTLAVLLCLVAAALAEDRTLSGLTQLINPSSQGISYPSAPSPVYGLPQEQQSSYGVPSQEVHGWKTDENQGFTVQSGYEGFILPTGPAPEGLGLGALGGVALGTKLLTALLPFPFNKIALLLETKVGFWLLGLLLLVLLGAATTTAFCAFTPICSIHFIGLRAINREETRAFITQQRIDQVTQFVHDAIDRFSKLQARVAKELTNRRVQEARAARGLKELQADTVKENEVKSFKEPEAKSFKAPEAKSFKEPEAKSGGSKVEDTKDTNTSSNLNSVK